MFIKREQYESLQELLNEIRRAYDREKLKNTQLRFHLNENVKKYEELLKILNTKSEHCQISPAYKCCRWHIEIPINQIKVDTNQNKQDYLIDIDRNKYILCGKAIKNICPDYEPMYLNTDAPAPCVNEKHFKEMKK